MKSDKQIIICPDCEKKSRIPADKHIHFSCPGCSSEFEHKNGILIRSVKPKPISFGRKLFLIGVKILIGAVITWGLNFLLLKTGWNEWEDFSRDADEFTQNMIFKTDDLSPMTIILPTRLEVKNQTFIERVQTFAKGYWYNKTGNAFWFGRVLVIVVAIISILLAGETYETALQQRKRFAAFIFAINIIYRFFWLIYWISLTLVLIFMLLKLFLFLTDGIVALFTLLAAGGGFIKMLADEARQDITQSPKNKLTAFILSLYPKRK